MSASQTPHSYNPWNGLLHAVAERLIPLFLTPGHTTEHARAIAREAIIAYHPESRADYASIGRILALSLAAITAIGNAAEPDLPPALQLRFFTKANSLSRSAEQAERAMTRRRQQRSQRPDTEDDLLASPDTEAPVTTMAVPEPRPAEAMVSATPAQHTSVNSVPSHDPANEAIFAQIDAAIAEFHALLPAAQRPPFAAMPDTPPQSFRQSLRNHAPIGLLHPKN